LLDRLPWNTSVAWRTPWLDAKPEVGLVVGVESMRDAEGCVRPLAEIEYEHRGEAGVPGRLALHQKSV